MRILRFLELLPTIIGSALVAMMQTGPDEAEINLCKWPKKLWPSLPDACLHGTPTWLLYLISIVLFLAGLIWFFWPRIITAVEFTWPLRRKKALDPSAKIYVADINITIGLPPSTEPVLLIGHAARNEARLRIVVEHSYFAIGGGLAGWHAPTPVVLDDLRDVFIGQKIMIHIVTASPHGEPPKLMWGSHDGPLVNSIQKGRYRARIRFIGIDGEQAPAYFLLTALGNGDPNLISVTLDCDFAFISEWEKTI